MHLHKTRTGRAIGRGIGFFYLAVIVLVLAWRYAIGPALEWLLF